MRDPLIDAAENMCKRPGDLEFEIGDTVKVTIRIVEGGKQRLQKFEGIVIARRGAGTSEMFTVRRIVANQGVERAFPIHSPNVAGIEVVRHGRVRRCKLYYLRERVGKARKLRERRISAEARKQAAAARAEKARKQLEAAEAIAASRADDAEASDTEVAASAT